jgi:hypothetical protein
VLFQERCPGKSGYAAVDLPDEDLYQEEDLYQQEEDLYQQEKTFIRRRMLISTGADVYQQEQYFTCRMETFRSAG